jgi:integrase
MPTGKITIANVKALAPGDRDIFLWDTERSGFGVKCTPTGKKVYILQYRMHGGRGAKIKRYTIGQHGTWTPDSAGKEAERLLRLVGQGVDPSAQKVRARIEADELAFAKYADRFLDQYVKPNWPRSYGFPESALRLYAKPHFRDTPLPQIEAKAIARFYDGLPTGKPGLRRNVHVVLRRLMRWAKGRGDIASDPFDGFESPAPVASRDRVLTDHEVRTLWMATGSVAAPFGCFIRLLLLTGQRRNEVAGLDWKELDRDAGQWLIPASRAKNGIENLLPLSPQAIAELDSLAAAIKWPRRGLVFTTTGKSPISGFSKAKRILDAAMLNIVREDDPHAELDQWRFHDLRRTMATDMQRLRISGDVIEACENRIAGRSKAGAARVYQRHSYEEEKREAMERWGAFVAALVAKSDNVVPLAKAG